MSTWRLALILALAACRPKPPEVLPREPERDPPVEVTTPLPELPPPVLLPRPDIDLSSLVADPTHELRWPLSISNHPELEPQFEIAAALAEPGVGWIDLCRLGAQNRHLGRDKRDHVTYLRAWCSVGKQDIDGALASLAPLKTSVVSGIAPAVRADFANILVSSGDATDARRLIAKHRIADISILDALAASYVEIGKLDDAYEINELALTNDDRRNKANRCQRLTRRYVLRPPPKQIKAIDLPNASLFDVVSGSDETCTRLEHELECWLDPAAGCLAYHTDQKLDLEKVAMLRSAHRDWYLATATKTGWWHLANKAEFSMPLPAAEVLAVAALTNNLRTTQCNSSHITKIVLLAEKIRKARHDPASDDKLSELIEGSTRNCRSVMNGASRRQIE